MGLYKTNSESKNCKIVSFLYINTTKILLTMMTQIYDQAPIRKNICHDIKKNYLDIH